MRRTIELDPIGLALEEGLELGSISQQLADGLGGQAEVISSAGGGVCTLQAAYQGQLTTIFLGFAERVLSTKPRTTW
ncbi:MAG: hypothetical protein KC457_02980, partial [Myxococcales bacterium]|nr:hypothetical protein [Myxococcales bacterium]